MTPATTPDPAYVAAKLDGLALHLLDGNGAGIRAVLADMVGDGYSYAVALLGSAVTDVEQGEPILSLRQVLPEGWGPTRIAAGPPAASTSGSELLEAARRVTRPNTWRIRRELGVSLVLAYSLARTLRAEHGAVAAS